LAVSPRAQARIHADAVSPLGQSPDELRARGRLRVGLYEDFAPFSAAGSEGPVGIDIDVARLIAARLGLELEPVLVAAGETVEDDLRNHVWRGTVVDHATVNLLLHVPYARELQIRNELAVLVRPYFTESLALARDPERLPDEDALEGQLIGVELDSLASVRLGRLREQLVHYRRPEEGLAALRTGVIAAFAGLSSQIEAGLGPEQERSRSVPCRVLASPPGPSAPPSARARATSAQLWATSWPRPPATVPWLASSPPTAPASGHPPSPEPTDLRPASGRHPSGPSPPHPSRESSPCHPHAPLRAAFWPF
jgi:ABC-type amino acid transport substrate-binding protein